MSKDKRQDINERVKEELGLIPPAFKIAEKLGDDFKDVIGDYYEIIYTDDVLPLKYKYLMAIATAIMAEHKPKAMVDTKKALKYGATPREVKEVLRMTIWWCGAPTMVKIVPDILQYLEKKEEE
ncbi:MAG: carboxymuconolactone decarboxylase family protein [Halanaerobiaceae bacterium]